MSPIKRMTRAFSSAGDRSSRFPGGDMPLQNLKSLHAKSPDLPIFTRAVSPMPPYSCRQQNPRCPDFCPYYHERREPTVFSGFISLWETKTEREQPVLLAHGPGAREAESLPQPQHRFESPDRSSCRVK